MVTIATAPPLQGDQRRGQIRVMPGCALCRSPLGLLRGLDDEAHERLHETIGNHDGATAQRGGPTPKAA